MERRRFTREFKLEAVRLIGITRSRTRRHRSLTRHGAFIPLLGNVLEVNRLAANVVSRRRIASIMPNDALILAHGANLPSESDRTFRNYDFFDDR